MSYPSLNRQGQAVASFLSREVQSAYQKALSLDKSDLSKNATKTANEIIEEHIIDGLELGKPTAKIDENKPNTASVSWPVTRGGRLLGMTDSSGQTVEGSSNSMIRRELDYQTPIADSPQLQQEIKSRITSITNAIEQHFLLVNTAVTEHNRNLRASVPGWVAERLKIVSGTKAAEDFLNS